MSAHGLSVGLRRTRRWVADHWGVLVVAALALRIARNWPLSFDGSMNIQVAQELVAGRGYRRFYGEWLSFPWTVQTNGPFMFLSAAFLAVMGHTNLAMQMANVVAVVGLALVLHRLVPTRLGWLVVVVSIFGIPRAAEYTMNGYGEVSVAALEVLAIVLLAVGLHRADHRRVVTSGIVVALAVLTKVVAVAVFVPVVVLFAAMWRQTSSRRRLVGWWCVGAVLPMVLFECYRVLTLGSLSAWRTWWRLIGGQIGAQSGVSDSASHPTLLHSLRTRFHTLASGFGFGTTAFVLLIGVVMVLLGIELVRTRARRQPRSVDQLLDLALFSFVCAYSVWWLFVTPLEKAWIRRIMIALIVLVVLVGRVVLRRIATEGVLRGGQSAVVLALVLLVAAPLLENVRLIARADRTTLRDVEAAAAFVRAQAATPDTRWYGIGWWSAPVISAYADIEFGNLGEVEPCDLRGDREFLIWDRYAALIASPEPPLANFGLSGSVVAAFGANTTVWRVQPAGPCPAASE